MNDFIKKTFIVFIAVIASLFLAEGVTRVFFDPVDYLWPRQSPDEILRLRINPNSRAHDSWGFRNKYVPERADIVAIGDSQTYGISALAKYTWPETLERLTGKEVYNLALGGYGPAEYLYLMEHKAVQLKPDLIIAGFYLGNDLADSYEAVYTVPYWEDLRKPDLVIKDDTKADSSDKPEEKNRPHATSLQTRLKYMTYVITDWFAGHSVLYRIVTETYLGDMIRQRRMIDKGEEIVMFRDNEHEINTGFTPETRLRGLDLTRPHLQEGLRLALGFFNQMNETAGKNGIRFLVVIIPTKETVFAEFIEGNDSLAGSRKIDRLIDNERLVNEIVKSYFEEHNISYLDVLEPLRRAVPYEQIYPNNYNGHSNKNGYRIIAETIYQNLNGKQDD